MNQPEANWSSAQFLTRASILLAGIGAWGIGLATPTYADVVPYVTMRYTHDDNLFRLSDQANTVAILGTSGRSDNYYRAEAGLDLNAQVSRQRFNVRASVNRTQFTRFEFLDNTGGAGRINWEGMMGRDWQTRAGYDYTRSLASFEVQSGGRNIRTDRLGYGQIDYRIFPSLRWRTGVDVYDVSNSLPARQTIDYEAVTALLALHYVRPTENFIGPQLKVTNGDFPNPEIINGTSVDNSFDETVAGVALDWRTGGHTRVQAEAGYTDRQYDRLPARDFSGFTGRLVYDWDLSAKTLLNAVVWRELTAADDLSAAYVLAKGASVGPRWTMTTKVTLQAGLSHERRDFEGDPRVVLNVAAPRSDRLNAAVISVTYLPTLKIQLGGSYEAGQRRSSQALTDYRYHSISGNLRVEF